MTGTREWWADRLFLLIYAALILVFAYLTRYGFDVEDEALYLYYLVYPRNEAQMSGFAWPFSAFGSLFEHSVIGYRLLAIAILSVGSWFFFTGFHAALEARTSWRIPYIWGTVFCGIAVFLHLYRMPSTLSYNTSAVTAANLLGGTALWMVSRAHIERAHAQWPWLLATGSAAMLMSTARPLSSVVLLIALGVFLAGMTYAERDQRSLAVRIALSFVAGMVLGVVAGLLDGNIGAVIDVHQITASTLTAGYANYILKIASDLEVVWKVLSRHWLAVTVFAATIAVLMQYLGATTRFATLAALAAAFALVVAWPAVTGQSFYIVQAGTITFIAVTTAVIALLLDSWYANRSTAEGRAREIMLALVVTIALATIFLSVIGSSNNLIRFSNVNPVPYAALLGLAIAGVPAETNTRNGAGALPMLGLAAVLVAGSWHVVHMRWNYSYISPPFSALTRTLDDMGPLTGLKVSPQLYDHLTETKRARSKIDDLAPDTKALSLYSSPGTIFALDVPAVASPWMFIHVGDAVYNCRIIGLDTSRPRDLLIVVQTKLREEMLDCLSKRGVPPRDQWEAHGCFTVTPGRSWATKEKQSCLYRVRTTNEGVRQDAAR